MSEFLKVYKVFYRCLTNVIIIFAVITAAAYLSGIRVYCVRSASMGDSVPLGSLCFVSTYTSYESIVPGDIIAFSANDDLRVTHRAVFSLTFPRSARISFSDAPCFPYRISE